MSGEDGYAGYIVLGNRETDVARVGTERLGASAVPGLEERVAIDFPMQRLEIGDVIALPEQGTEVEATVTREIERTELTVRPTLRVAGREDFIKEWPVGEMVTVVRGCPFVPTGRRVLA